MKLPVAIQVYSVRDDAANDLRGTLEKIKEMGYDGVEFAGLYGNSPEDIRAMGRRLAGPEAFFLQTFKDSGDLIAGGEAFTPAETRVLLAALQENVPNAQIRGE